MRNVKTEKKGDLLIITINTKETPIESTSGKSLVVASSEGNQTVTEFPDLKIGVNVYRANPNKAPKGK